MDLLALIKITCFVMMSNVVRYLCYSVLLCVSAIISTVSAIS